MVKMARIRNPSGKNMKLILLLPGLAWLDAHDGGEVSKALPLPALQQMLGKGRLERKERGLSACVEQLWGAPPAGLAALAAEQAGLAGDANGCSPTRFTCGWTATGHCWPMSA